MLPPAPRDEHDPAGALPANVVEPTSLQQSRALVSQLKRSQIFRDYEQAFRETTGLPIALRAIETFDLPLHGDPKENPFCLLMARSNHSCAACLQLQKRVEEEARLGPKTLKCFAGLCDSAVPVRVGDNLIAFLQTGQILLHRPTRTAFAHATRELVRWGTEVDLTQLEEAFFQTRVVTRKQYESILRLLTIFAQHLAALSNQLMVQEAAAESPAVAKARAYIAEHQADELSLTQVAQAVNMSAFYFCKTFKKATGMTFTDYLARVRVEKVKNILLNPHKRVSEAAYEAGFQSLSQFNRVFRRIAGESPSVYRDRLHGPGTPNGLAHAA
ncbi:MAG TPA: helix-turn-helix domain-containing protein [Opitutaceae bacterium]|nr:helix-turn-helix domain-containing protein [Opitutaceae bacterium]